MQSWKSRPFAWLLAVFPLVVCAQAPEELNLVKGKPVEVSAPGAKQAALSKDFGEGPMLEQLDVSFDAAGKATITGPQVNGLIAGLQGATSATLELLNAGGNAVKQYKVIVPASNGASASTAAAAETGPGARTTGGRRASVDDCAAAAAQWKRDNRKKGWIEGESALVLFTPDGQYCYDTSTRTVRQGDDIYVGVVSFSDDAVIKAPVQFTPCEAEDAEPNLYISSSKPSLLAVQSAREVANVTIYDVRRCFNATTKVSIEITSIAGTNKGDRSINLYDRYRGTLQIGALYTDLHEADFGLVDSGGQQVIFNKEPLEKGPEYVASVLVYGIPHYFDPRHWGKDAPAYRGRDIINDNTWADRLGLIFTVGLDDPGDRFGVGLSFEIAYGINIFYSKHWFRQKELVGVALGDQFTGAADDIPTRHEWADDASFGISFDLRYITALFDKK